MRDGTCRTARIGGIDVGLEPPVELRVATLNYCLAPKRAESASAERERVAKTLYG
jgi:hypothetical protein